MGAPPQATERDDVEEGLLQNEKEDKFFLPEIHRKKNFTPNRQRHWYWSWIVHFALFIPSLTLFILSRYNEPSDAACTRKLYPYSPAFEAIEYHETNLRGVFDAPSAYRGTPNPQLDLHWEELVQGSAVNIPVDKLHLLNMTYDANSPYQRTEAKFGGGYAAPMWGFHQLHCLNVLRQVTYKEVYHEQGRLPQILEASESYRREHTNHCIELLRQDMVCQADVTPYFIRKPPSGHPDDDLQVDFSIRKKCRNFDKIKSWVRSRIAIESFNEPFVNGVELDDPHRSESL